MGKLVKLPPFQGGDCEFESRPGYMDELFKDAKAELDTQPPPVVHEYDNKWWFWDECWADRMGPFETRAETEEALSKYCREYLGLW